MLLFQLEVKRQVEDFRRQKEEEEREQEVEELLRAEIEKEEKRRISQLEISRFRERVRST